MRKRVGVCLLLLLLLSAFLFSVVLEVYSQAGNNLLVDSFEDYQASSSPSVGRWGMIWGDGGDQYQAMSSAYLYLLHKSLQLWRGEVMSSEQALTRLYRMLGRTVGNVIQQATVLSVDVWTNKGGQGHNVDDGTYRLFKPITFYFRSTCRLCNPFLVVVGPYGRFNFYLTGCFEPDRTYQLPPIHFNEERDVGEWTIIMYATPEGAVHPMEVDRLRIWINSQTTTACELEITSVTFIDKETDREISPPINVGQEFSVAAKVRNVGSSSICIFMSELNVDWSPRDLLEDHTLLCVSPPRELKPGEEAAVFYCGYFKALKPGYVTFRLKARGYPGYTPPEEKYCEFSLENYCETVKEVTLEIISGGVATTTIYTTVITTTTSTIHATATSWSTTYTTASATTYTTSTRTWYTTVTRTVTKTMTRWTTVTEATVTTTQTKWVSYEGDNIRVITLSLAVLAPIASARIIRIRRGSRRSGGVSRG